MAEQPLARSERERQAELGWEAIQPSPSEHARLTVQCRAGHHVAAVYETPAGLVYRSVPRRHSHGGRDFVDTPHHGDHAPHAWVDLLDIGDGGADLEDALPSWCECGARQLSRAALQVWQADRLRKVVID